MYATKTRPVPPGLSVEIRLYGWDSRRENWHGPNALGCCAGPDARLLRSLRGVTGKSWYGGVTCGMPGEPATRFFAMVHDLSDCAIASIYCQESKVGPCEILAVIPAQRRAGLRDDFAFEFLSFASFLGSLSPGAVLQVHDAIAAALAEPCDSSTLVFSISAGLWPRDKDLALSCCVEKIAVTLERWMLGNRSTAV